MSNAQSPLAQFSLETACKTVVFTKQGCVGTLPVEALIGMNQTHSNDVVEIQQKNDHWVWMNPDSTQQRVAAGAHSNATSLAHRGVSYTVKGDAMFTNHRGVILTVKTADCLPILVAADDYVGVIHAGREGTLAGISKRMAMQFYDYGVRRVSCWFGPASCVCCYQIDRETNSYFDLISENQSQWRAIFGQEVYFYLSDDCTQCSPDRFFSYRSGDSADRNVFGIARL
ncbi:MAG: polyphenol oxidase family protein [Candidatus Marinamargulisbacteria bacterium]